MIKFKVGDRVRFREDFGSYPAGFVAYVHRLDHEGDPEICTPGGQADNFCTSTLLDIAEVVDDGQPPVTTLTRRDHFAMAALTGLLSGHMAAEEGATYADRVSNGAYEIADAMEAARNKEGAE